MTQAKNPALYILMRTDMDSLTPGKAMAQAAHAANAFEFSHSTTAGYAEWSGLDKVDEDWQQGFGTTIVLGVGSERELVEVTNSASEDEFAAGVVHDNSYPIRDGSVVHHLPINTCGYVFTPCRKDHPISSLAGLTLYK